MSQDTPEQPQGFQIAWTEVEDGWAVIASDGTEAGKVEQGVGDRDEDIFGGFEIDIRSAGDRFLSYEHIVSIVPGEVHVSLSRAELERLPEHREVESVRVQGDPASLNDRFRTDIHHSVEHVADDSVQGTDERLSWLQRLRRLLGLR
ncbi:MAG: hypothetical protein QOJ13_323 [Gaiellales bacterium]|jgi:hypothetical protein|nr:hypothetical protein [Gaiellales bacterium]